MKAGIKRVEGRDSRKTLVRSVQVGVRRVKGYITPEKIPYPTSAKSIGDR